jgi:flagellar hook-basal body complex protein FliE
MSTPALPVAPVASFPSIDGAALVDRLARTISAPPGGGPAGASFAQMIQGGIDETNRKLAEADKMVRAFALDDSIPVHQVTYALEQARLSLELMMQVRSRLIEGYQQFMNMQV